MKHLAALLIKAAFIEAIALAILLLAGASLGQAIVIGAVTTVVLYLLGDMTVLPTLGNFAATVGDGGLAVLTAWLGRYYTGADIGLVSALLFGALVGLFEFFFHLYLKRSILPGSPADIR